MTTPRDRLARALVTVLWDENAHGDPLPVPLDNLCDANRAMLYRGADACLALLATEPVSYECVEIFAKSGSATAFIRAWLGSPPSSAEGVAK